MIIKVIQIAYLLHGRLIKDNQQSMNGLRLLQKSFFILRKKMNRVKNPFQVLVVKKSRKGLPNTFFHPFFYRKKGQVVS